MTDAVAPKNAEAIYATILNEAEAWAEGRGPDRRKEWRKLASDHGLEVDEVIDAAADGREARAGTKPLSLMDKIKQAIGPDVFISEGNAQSEQKAAPEPEPEIEPEPAVSLYPYFQRAGEDKSKLPVVLTKTAVLDNARTFARRKCWKNGELAAVHWHGKFWKWNGRVYAEWGETEVRSTVTQFLDQSFTRKDSGNLDRYIPKPKDPDALIGFLRDGLAISEALDPPIWFENGLVDKNLMVFKNKIVDLEFGDEIEPDPRLWIHASVDYEWDADAECPTWDRFLGEVFPGDSQSQRCVEEQIGLAMTGDLSFEKGLMLIGQTRSGKSTITKVASELVGGAYVSLDANKWVSKDTSLEVLIGKRLGVFEDMRLRPAKWYGASFDPGGLDHVSVEVMLKLTSGNSMTVARKYIKDWQGIIPIHLWVVSNEVPTLNDGVLPGRFIKLAFEQCFYGREDTGLKGRLCQELPGIAQRCVRAYRLAKGRGSLIQPEAGEGLRNELEAMSDPFMGFVQDMIVVDGNLTVTCSKLFNAFELWCAQNDQASLMRTISDASRLTKRLKKVPGLHALQTTSNHPREYLGIGLRRKK